MLIASVCSRESYNALTNWLTDARTMASPDIVIVLVGNKKDLEVRPWPQTAIMAVLIYFDFRRIEK